MEAPWLQPTRAKPVQASAETSKEADIILFFFIINSSFLRTPSPARRRGKRLSKANGESGSNQRDVGDFEIDGDGSRDLAKLKSQFGIGAEGRSAERHIDMLPSCDVAEGDDAADNGILIRNIADLRISARPIDLIVIAELVVSATHANWNRQEVDLDRPSITTAPSGEATDF